MVDKNKYPELTALTRRVVSKTILITGNARSGTTIAGKIIGSCKNCEYFFEPELLLSLFIIIDKIPKAAWMLLFETYVGEDLMAKAVMGRNLNLRKHDDSAFYNTNTRKEYKKRTLFKGNRLITLQKIRNKIPVIKIPDITSYLPKFQRYYPKIKIIVCTRNPDDVKQSLMKKKWYYKNNSRFVWPFYRTKSLTIPFWFKKNKQIWKRLNEYQRIQENIKNNIITAKLKYFVFSYDKLLNKPKKVRLFLQHIALKKTWKTIQNIKRFKKN